MAKCFITGIELPLHGACILNQGATRRALRRLKERVAAMERLLAQFMTRDSVQVYNPKTRKSVTRSQARLVCPSVASALSGICPDTQLFITWQEYIERRAAFARQGKSAQLKAISQPQAVLSASTLAPPPPSGTPANGQKPKHGSSSKPKKLPLGVGNGHAGAQ